MGMRCTHHNVRSRDSGSSLSFEADLFCEVSADREYIASHNSDALAPRLKDHGMRHEGIVDGGGFSLQIGPESRHFPVQRRGNIYGGEARTQLTSICGTARGHTSHYEPQPLPTHDRCHRPS